MRRTSSEKLTTPDLVLLSLLAERPMHGYQANAVLEFRKVREWAGVSRPQIYYSLEKLARLNLISPLDSEGSAGPERRVFETTAAGRAALAAALEREDWTNQKSRPPFLTWLALSWQARPGIFLSQIALRRAAVERELTEAQTTLRAVLAEVGHEFHEAVWILKLHILQAETELKWLETVAREFPRRAAAQIPQYPEE